MIVAVLGYLAIASYIITGVVAPNFAALAVGLLGIFGVILIANPNDLHSRLPLFKSPNQLVSMSGWVILGAIALVLIPLAAPPQEAGDSDTKSVAQAPAGAAQAPASQPSAVAVALAPTKAPAPPTATPMRPTPIPPTATPVPAKAVAAPPSTIEGLPTYLEAFLPPEAKGQVELLPIAGGQGVSAMFTIADNFTFNQRTLARKSARDFVFAAYATGLPIVYAQIVIMQPNETLGLSVTLGANVAATQPTSTWTDSSIGPTIFLDWMKSQARLGANRNGPDRAYIAGPWAD